MPLRRWSAPGSELRSRSMSSAVPETENPSVPSSGRSSSGTVRSASAASSSSPTAPFRPVCRAPGSRARGLSVRRRGLVVWVSVVREAEGDLLHLRLVGDPGLLRVVLSPLSRPFIRLTGFPGIVRALTLGSSATLASAQSCRIWSSGSLHC